MAKISKKTALLWVLVVAAVLSIWRFIFQPFVSREQQVTTSVTSVETPTSETSVPKTEVVGETKTASVQTSYKNPGGEDKVGFSVSVDESGTITKASVDVLATNPTSKMRQQAFAAGLPKAIEGKKISDLTAIDKVGGSSLTTNSFNASLAQLKAGI